MRIIASIISLALLASCNIQKNLSQKDYNNAVPKYISTITEKELTEHLYTFASNDFEGRMTGELGQKKAANYLKDFYESQNIKSPWNNNNYFQNIPVGTFKKLKKQTENVVAFIEGKEKPEEVLVISAHYDHIGLHDGEIFNGADDDGSGTVAVLEIAEAFKQAVKDGYQPKRSILFLHFTGEELGLYGSRYYTDKSPIFPLANTVADLNIDMIGRIDDAHKENSNYIYLIGSDKLSTDLHNLSEVANKKYGNLNLDYTYNDENDPNRFYYRSDHYNFAKNNVPVIFYFNGTHEDYHKATDTPDKINYKLLTKRTKLVFATAWEIANRPERIVVDKASK